MAATGGASDSGQLAYAYAVSNQRPEAMAIVRSLIASEKTRYVPPFGIAIAYAGLGDIDQAFEWLNRGERARETAVGLVGSLPAFEQVRRDPRYPPLARRLRVPY